MGSKSDSISLLFEATAFCGESAPAAGVASAGEAAMNGREVSPRLFTEALQCNPLRTYAHTKKNTGCPHTPFVGSVASQGSVLWKLDRPHPAARLLLQEC